MRKPYNFIVCVSCLPILTDGTANAPQRSSHTVVPSPPRSVALL